MFNSLCSTDEKNDAFYKICIDPYPTAALSQHLVEKFPQHNWDAVEAAHRIRESAVPSFGFRQLLPWLALIAAVVPLVSSNPFKVVETALRAALDSDNPLDPSTYVLIAATYTGVFFVGYPSYLAWTRRKLKRAGFVLKYLTIR